MADRWVESFRGHVLAFTGKVLVDGDWTIREDCVRMAMLRGAADWKTDMSGKVSLLVHGDLASANVTDRTRQFSKKLKLADALRQDGHTLAVIDGQGFSDLISGFPARNRDLLVRSPSEVLVLPRVGEGILGGPLTTRAPVTHGKVDLQVDLEALDRGTAAHEGTVAAFADAIVRAGHLPERAGRLAPAFDLGWATDNSVFVAEVKSLGSATEAQQIRLGLGQVLDYAQQIRDDGLTLHSVKPVVVLERRPVSSDHWMSVATSAGVFLTWGPQFRLPT